MTRLSVLILFLIASLTSSSTLATSASATPSGVHRSLVPTWVWKRVFEVHICEEGNGRGSWHWHGPTYEGGLGWRVGLWPHWKRPSWPVSMGDASPQQQAWGMWQFVTHTSINGHPKGWWPDNPTCNGGY